MLRQCRTHWRELTFAAAVLVITSMAVITGLYFGRPGWHVDNDAIENLIVSAEEAMIADGPGNLVSNDFAGKTKDGGESFYVVEDMVTGQAIKRSNKARSPTSTSAGDRCSSSSSRMRSRTSGGTAW
jgi:hypothetical protein